MGESRKIHVSLHFPDLPLSHGREVVSLPGRSRWVGCKPSQAQKMPAANLGKEIPLAFKRCYWGSSFSAADGGKQSFPCWPPVRSAFQQQLICSHVAHPFTWKFVSITPSSWQWSQGSRCLRTPSQMALQSLCSILKGKQPAGKPGPIWSWDWEGKRRKRSCWFRYPGREKI